MFLAGYAGGFYMACRTVNPDAICDAANILLDAYVRGARVYVCGNGGSAAIANHFACDHSKGIRNGTKLLPKVTSLSSSTELLTAISNDISFEEVFSYQLEAAASPGDILIAVSSSGKSVNICRALSWAGQHDMITIALTGFDGGEANRIASIPIHVDSDNYGIVEDVHQAIAHSLAQYIRQRNMNPDDIASTVF
jgi:D-sedoheptulose 7-phosphate isomerase/D-glycero-D-manno-heptose 1,7-bisphosphate phosphatase